MLKDSFLELKAKLDENKILLTFAGAFSQEIIEDLGAAIQKFIQSDGTPKNNTYNVFSVYIEQTQNIRNYLSSRAEDSADDTVLNSGIVTIGRNEDRYFVYSGNMVEKLDAEALSGRIKQLNTMSKEDLKAAYKEQLKKSRSQDPATARNAGLGLIEISRKARLPIEYALTAYDDNYDFFTMKVIV